MRGHDGVSGSHCLFLAAPDACDFDESHSSRDRLVVSDFQKVVPLAGANVMPAHPPRTNPVCR